MAEPLTLPIFPLPGVFLAPGQVLPLHIFEPRYQEMLTYAMERDQRFAMAHPDPRSRAEIGSAPVFPVCGLGRVLRVEHLIEGRANVLLQGESRLRIVSELPVAHAFRLVAAEAIPELPLDEEALAEGIQELQAQIEALDARLIALLRGKPIPLQVDCLLPCLDADTEVKLRIYAEPDQGLRLRAVLELLRGRRQQRLDLGPDDPRRN